MIVFFDSNVLISAANNENGTPYMAFSKAVISQAKIIICEQNLEEMRRVFNRKFPERLYSLERFLAFSLPRMIVVNVPDISLSNENTIRDVQDRMIYRAAVMARTDILITGDKDLLESGISNPKILTPAQYLKL